LWGIEKRRKGTKRKGEDEQGTGGEGKDELNFSIIFNFSVVIVLLLLIINFIRQHKHKKIAIQQSIPWSNMLNSRLTEVNKSAVTSACWRWPGCATPTR